MIIGWTTNWAGLWMIFNPIEPRRFLGRDWQGLFLRRQPEVAGVYAKIIADEIVTIGNLGRELLEGPRADRTRYLIETAVRPSVDGALGPARSAVRVAVGTSEYDAIRESVGREAVDYTLTPLQDEDFNARQGEAVRDLITERIKEMPSTDFAEMLHTAIKQDEWMLLLHGAVLGFGAGLIHLAIFGVALSRAGPAARQSSSSSARSIGRARTARSPRTTTGRWSSAGFATIAAITSSSVGSRVSKPSSL